MIKIGLLLTCLIIGFLLRRTPLFDERSPIVLNNLIIYFFIPVITLRHVPNIDFQANLIWLSITPFMVYILGFLFFKLAGYFFSIDRNTEGALVMCSGIGSTSFVGFPVFEILYGEAGLSLGIILSLAGTILVFNTLGVFTGLTYAQKEGHYAGILKKMFTFPPFVAFLMAILINWSGLEYPATISMILQQLSAPFSVLALLAIGMQINFSLPGIFFEKLLLGQSYKLILAPLIIYIFMWHLLGIQDLTARICILGAAIGSMNAVSILAAQLNLAPRLSVLMPAIGIPISVPILFLIDYLIS